MVLTVLKVYMELGSYFVSARTNKRHHHHLRERPSRGLCGLVCPSRTSERGGKGDCVKEGGEEEGERERSRANILVTLAAW